MKNELAKRSSYHIKASQLSYSCYRIRRKFSLQLPVSSLPKLDFQVRGFNQNYPWQIWCLWALEERLYALSAPTRWSNEDDARRKCAEDLEALAQWPHYTVANKLDLPYGHAVQLMATALRDWTWLSEATRSAMKAALQRAVDEGEALVPGTLLELSSPQDLLTKPNPHQYLHNIPLIAQAALAMAAEVIGHTGKTRLSQRFRLLFEARLALSLEGLTEGISYDGYLGNFALAWLSTQPVKLRESIISHPAILDLEAQARCLACPGAVWQSAEIGDVEPQEMPFVWSALVRLQQFSFSSSREALLDAVPAGRMRSDALILRDQLTDRGEHFLTLSEESPVPVQCRAASVTLATGFASDDLSVVISLCRSPMNHIQVDSGTILIGHAGCWWITDPGYQQYLKTSEREFTLGAAAHNTPVINGHSQIHKAAYLRHSGQLGPEGAYAVLDLAACYPVESQVEIATRTVWRLGREHVVICDTVVAGPDTIVEYSWHGDAEAYWGEQHGAISLYHTNHHKTLWIQSAQQSLSLTQQRRLRGSRGPCSLQVHRQGMTHHWWSFSLTDAPPAFEAHLTRGRVGGISLDLADTLPTKLPEPLIKLNIHRDQLQISIQRGDESLAPAGASDWEVSIVVNGQPQQRVSTRGRQLYLPIPAMSVDDSVILRAQALEQTKSTAMVIEHLLSDKERRQICSIPLRVYGERQDDQVTAECMLMPGVLDGELEYAFYLLVEGHKSQVSWYKSSPNRCFTLTSEEKGKTLQVRGFVREVAEPDHKLSASSGVL